MALCLRARVCALGIAVAGIALGAPVLACPTALGKGVSLRYASGASSQVMPGPAAGQVVVRTRYAGDVDEGDVITSWFGVYDLSYVEYGPNSGPVPYAEYLSYPGGTPPLPLPELEKLDVDALLETPGGPVAEINRVSSGVLGPLTLGGCPFEGFTLTSTVLPADETSADGVTWSFVFLPALGVGIQQGDGEMDVVVALEALQ